MEIKKRLEKEEELIRKRLVDLTRTTSDESTDESDNDEERTNHRKDIPIDIKTESIDQPTRPIISPKIG